MRKHAGSALQDEVESSFTDQVEVRWQILEGSPPHAIVDFARDHHVDLIVLCTHGESGLARLIFGSVAEKVMRLAPCAVLTVPSEDPPYSA